jgi:homoserine acetyltransferase
MRLGWDRDRRHRDRRHRDRWLRPLLGATLAVGIAAVIVIMTGATGMSPASAQPSPTPVESSTRADPDPSP